MQTRRRVIRIISSLINIICHLVLFSAVFVEDDLNHYVFLMCLKFKNKSEIKMNEHFWVINED